MEWIVLAIVVIFVLSRFGKSKSGGGERRKFKCDQCGTNSWAVDRVSHYDDEDRGDRYNYKEWLRCLKCGNSFTNEKKI
jgi:hypothetical protein